MAEEFGLQGVLHWPMTLPQHVAAGTHLQDVLHCLVFWAAAQQVLSGGGAGEMRGWGDGGVGGGRRDLFLICKSVMKVILVWMQRDSRYFQKGGRGWGGGGGGNILTCSRCRRWLSVEVTLISVSTIIYHMGKLGVCVGGGGGGAGEEQQKCRSRKKQVGRERRGKDTERQRKRERWGQRMYKQCRDEDRASKRTENVCTNKVGKPNKLKRQPDLQTKSDRSTD